MRQKFNEAPRPGRVDGCSSWHSGRYQNLQGESLDAISKSAASKRSQGTTVPPGHGGQPLPLLTFFDCDPC